MAAFCVDCPDHEACATSWPCWKVKEVHMPNRVHIPGWGVWFVEWEKLCASYCRAWQMGASDTILGSYIAAQQRWLKQIPPPN